MRQVKAGDREICLAPGALEYLVRHSFRERIFEFSEPYAKELAELGGTTLADLVDLAVSVGWFRPATAVEIFTHLPKVDELKAALLAHGQPARGKRKRADLQAACLVHCTDWMEKFVGQHPAYYTTDQGRIELEATRPVVVPRTRESHRKLMREFLKRDVNEAKQWPNVILGIKIFARNDLNWLCKKGKKFVGVYLPDEVPQYYPSDCREDACCCNLSEMVLACDDTPEAHVLRERLAARKKSGS